MNQKPPAGAGACGAPLDPASRVMAVALGVLENEANAMSWLRRPQPGLGGDVPLDLLDTPEGADEVITVLERIHRGVYT